MSSASKNDASIEDNDESERAKRKGEEFSARFSLPSRLFSDSTEKTVLLECIDCHAGGEPARVVLSGLPPVPGKTAFEKRQYMMTHLDYLRQTLLLEPRGYPCQNVNFIFDGIALHKDDDGDCADDDDNNTTPILQYVIAEQGEIYPAMSGHNTICVATALLECSIIPMKEPTTCFTLEAPAGPIEITAKCSNGKARSITFRNEPSFVEDLDVSINVPTIGKVVVDIAYGGMWYAVVDAASVGLTLCPTKAREICRLGQMIKVATREQHPVQHPTMDYPGVDILVFREKATNGSSCDGRNAVVMTNQELDWKKPETWTAMLDRSPCGTGTCAVMVVMHARGELDIGQPFVHESIIGSTFTGVLVKEIPHDDRNAIPGRNAVIPEITGSAHITQYSKVVVDPEDPFPNGFRVGDIW